MTSENQYFLRGVLRLTGGLATFALAVVVLNVIGYLSLTYDYAIFWNKSTFPQFDSYFARAISLSILGLQQVLVICLSGVLAVLICAIAYLATPNIIKISFRAIVYIGGYRPPKKNA